MGRVEGLPRPYAAEPGSLDAIGEAADCLNACSMAEMGHADISVETLNSMWTLPEFDLESDVVFVRDATGLMVGVETAESREPFARVASWGGVRPGHTGRGIGSALMRWAGERARHRIALAPADVEVIHEVWYVAGHEPSEVLMADHGFEVNRYFNQMVVEFDGPPERPSIPAGIEIRQLRLGVDETPAALAADEAFSDHFGHIPGRPEVVIERLHHWLSQPDGDPTLYWIAWDGDEIAGHLWAWPVGDANPDYGYVGSLGVRRPWRGRGLGRALLLWSFQEFHCRGKGGAELEVDADSLTGALRLYESVGMKTHGVYAQGSRVIRPGRSLATTELGDDSS